MKELISRDERKYDRLVIRKILKNENFIKSVLLVTIECFLFQSNTEELLFNKISGKEYLNLDMFEFWKILNPFFNLVAIMDNNTVVHLMEIEVVLFTFLMWNNSEEFKKKFFRFVNSLNFVGKNFFYKIKKIKFFIRIF